MKAPSSASGRLLEEARRAATERMREEAEADGVKPGRFVVYDRKHLWALLHTASDQALRELYDQIMGMGAPPTTAPDMRWKNSVAELGHLLREYFNRRKSSPSGDVAATSPCPFCPYSKQMKAGAG